MEHLREILIIAGSCLGLLLLLFTRKLRVWVVNTAFRMIMGSLAILLINKGLVYGAGMSGIGLNPVTVLTSGILGFPGVAVLYGIYFYKML